MSVLSPAARISAPREARIDRSALAAFRVNRTFGGAAGARANTTFTDQTIWTAAPRRSARRAESSRARSLAIVLQIDGLLDSFERTPRLADHLLTAHSTSAASTSVICLSRQLSPSTAASSGRTTRTTRAPRRPSAMLGRKPEVSRSHRCFVASPAARSTSPKGATRLFRGGLRLGSVPPAIDGLCRRRFPCRCATAHRRASLNDRRAQGRESGNPYQSNSHEVTP